METQSNNINAVKEYERALKELKEGNVLPALACLEKALALRDNPSWYSYYGFCIAKERGYVTKGVGLCRTAIEHEPDNLNHYLYLGKTYLVAKNKIEALQVLRYAMTLGGTTEIAQLLEEIGTRKPPVFNFLSRDNTMNKYLGYILSRLKAR